VAILISLPHLYNTLLIHTIRQHTDRNRSVNLQVAADQNPQSEHLFTVDDTAVYKAISRFVTLPH